MDQEYKDYADGPPPRSRRTLTKVIFWLIALMIVGPPATMAGHRLARGRAAGN